LTRLERAVSELADHKASLLAALAVGVVLALVALSCCWALHRCLGRPKGRAVRRPQPGDARGAVALELPVVAAPPLAPAPIVAVAAAVPQPAPVPAPVVPAPVVPAPVVPAPPPAPVVAVAAPPPVVPAPPPAEEEVAVLIDRAVGALDAAEIQAVLAALRAVPRGGPLIPPPPPMGMELPPLARPPYVSGFSK